MDFLAGGEAAPVEVANGHVEQGVQDDPDGGDAGGFLAQAVNAVEEHTGLDIDGDGDVGVMGEKPVEAVQSLPQAGTYDPSYMLGGSVDTPPATRDKGSHSFAEGDIPLGTVGFNPKLSCVAQRAIPARDLSRHTRPRGTH